MSTHTANIMFHISDVLDEDGAIDIERTIAFENGVRTVCMNCKNRHLMIVDYDPEEIKALKLLSTIQSHGYHASMVGF